MAYPKVQVVSSPNQADYKVFFVNQDNQQNGHEIIMGGTLVNNSPDIKVCMTTNKNEAKIKITPENFPN